MAVGVSRRMRQATCPCGQPARKVKHAKLCSKCYSAARRPKKTCSACSGVFAADLLVGKRCRPCISQAAHSKRIVETYGLTADEYQELLVAQRGVCAICERHPRSKRLAVDHDHASGAVRGLLCRGCNRDCLGHLRDSVEALQRAIDYLTLPPAKRLWPDRDVTSKQEESS